MKLFSILPKRLRRAITEWQSKHAAQKRRLAILGATAERQSALLHRAHEETARMVLDLSVPTDQLETLRSTLEGFRTDYQCSLDGVDGAGVAPQMRPNMRHSVYLLDMLILRLGNEIKRRQRVLLAT